MSFCSPLPLPFWLKALTQLVFVDAIHGVLSYQKVHHQRVPFMIKAGKGTTENIFGKIVITFHGAISESQEKKFHQCTLAISEDIS